MGKGSVRTVGLVVAVLVVGLLGLQAGPAGAAARRSPRVRSDVAATWSTRADYPAYLTELTGVSCPNTSSCWAIGSATTGAPAIAATTDGGKSWKPQTLPTGILGLSGVSCPTARDCFVVAGSQSGAFVIATTDGGRVWKPQPLPHKTFSLTGISCASTSHCSAVGDTASYPIAIGTSNGGKSWKVQTLPKGLNELNAVSCASISRCWAVGNNYAQGTAAIVATTDAGRTWRSQAVPADIGVLWAVSCKSTADCLVSGSSTTTGSGEILSTTTSGKAWSAIRVATSSGLIGLSCSTTSDCTVAGYAAQPEATPVGSRSEQNLPYLASTTNRGNTWKPATLPGVTVGVSSVSCPTTTDCWVGGGTTAQTALVLATTDRGASWRRQALPAGIALLRGATCTSTAVCMAVGFQSSGSGGLIATADVGGAWTVSKAPASTPNLFLYSVTCHTDADCWAVGQTPANNGVILVTKNGGGSWKAQRAPTGTGALYSVSCASAVDCWASGTTTSSEGDVVATTNGGKTWVSQSLALPSPLGLLDALSCPSTSDCWAVGNSPSSINAVAVVTTDGGKTWALQTLAPGTAGVSQIDCLNTSVCYAVGSAASGSGLALSTIDGGVQWVADALPSQAGTLWSISCSGTDDCSASGVSSSGAGLVISTVNGGTSWQVNAIPSQTDVLYAIACAATSECLAFGIDARGGAVIISTGTPAPSGTRHAALSALLGVAGVVPRGFIANSITWLSAARGFLLGDAPCGKQTCTYVVGTKDGGQAWSLVGKIDAPIAEEGRAPYPGITEIRFATPEVGWAFGPYLYRTTDGGVTWTSETIPGGGKQVLSLVTNSSKTFATVSSCPWLENGNCAVSLWRTGSKDAKAWARASIKIPAGYTAWLSLFAKTVYLVDNPVIDSLSKNYLYASTNDGATFTARRVPCDAAEHINLTSLAPSSPTAVGLLCDGQFGLSLADKYAYVSTDTGSNDTFVGALAKPDANYGIQAQMAMSSSGDLAVASASDGSFMYINIHHGSSWTMVIGKSDGGLGWNDLVYATARRAWVIYAPADAPVALGEVYVTNDDGEHWSQVAL